MRPAGGRPADTGPADGRCCERIGEASVARELCAQDPCAPDLCAQDLRLAGRPGRSAAAGLPPTGHVRPDAGRGRNALVLLVAGSSRAFAARRSETEVCGSQTEVHGDVACAVLAEPVPDDPVPGAVADLGGGDVVHAGSVEVPGYIWIYPGGFRAGCLFSGRSARRRVVGGRQGTGSGAAGCGAIYPGPAGVLPAGVCRSAGPGFSGVLLGTGGRRRRAVRLLGEFRKKLSQTLQVVGPCPRSVA